MTQNKEKLNEQFYTLLKEIVETQSAIIAKLEEIENKVEGKPAGNVGTPEAWARM